jgi:hypothetical protein
MGFAGRIDSPGFPKSRQLIRSSRQEIKQNPDQGKIIIQSLQSIQIDLHQVNLQSNLDAFTFPSAFSLN